MEFDKKQYEKHIWPNDNASFSIKAQIDIY